VPGTSALTGKPQKVLAPAERGRRRQARARCSQAGLAAWTKTTSPKQRRCWRRSGERTAGHKTPVTHRKHNRSTQCSTTRIAPAPALLNYMQRPRSRCSSIQIPYRFANLAKRSASSTDRPRPGTRPAAVRAGSGRSPLRTGQAGTGRPVADEPVPVGCHVFPVPVEPSPAPRRALRAALPRGHTASAAGLPSADQGRQRGPRQGPEPRPRTRPRRPVCLPVRPRRTGKRPRWNLADLIGAVVPVEHADALQEHLRSLHGVALAAIERFRAK
jgi:hypothetical protein